MVASDKGSLLNFRGELIKAFVMRGIQVYAAAPELAAHTREAAELSTLGAVPTELPTLHRNSVAIFADLRSFFRLRRLVAQLRPGIVFAYTAKPVIYGLLVARLMNVPSRVALITGLGYAFIGSGKFDIKRIMIRQIVRGLYRASLAGATRVFFQNPDDRDCFLAQGLVAKRTPTYVVSGSGVNLRKFCPCPLPNGPTVFLMIARILRDKGVAEYIAAGRELKRVHPEIDVVLAGPFDSNPGAITPDELRDSLAGSGIRYLGMVTKIHELLAASHVYVLPSYREGTPRTVLEAMAVGRPIVTTDVPGCRETVQDGVNGFLVKERSVPALVEAMSRFLADPSLIAKMGANSLLLVRDKYDVSKVNATILEQLGV